MDSCACRDGADVLVDIIKLPMTICACILVPNYWFFIELCNYHDSIMAILYALSTDKWTERKYGL